MKFQQAISLFSGAGGMDLGIGNAGFDILCSIEKDEHCCRTLRANFKSTDVIEGDIRKINPSTLLRKYNVEKGQLDLLFGGPPCQAFSQIGKQNSLEDERGLLLFEMTRFAKALRPKVILVEQVTGLLSAKDTNGQRGGVLHLLKEELELLGYHVKLNILNAADYGVAQLRKRVFIIASMIGEPINFPEPTRHESETPNLFGLQAYTTVKQAIKGLGKPAEKAEKHNCADSHVDVTPDGDIYRITGVPEGECLAKQDHLPKNQIGKLTHKDTTKFLRLHSEKPSNTLRCGEIFFHPNENRYITPRECMRIHGYPDSFILKGPIRGRSGSVQNLDQYRQIANSVPPPLAHELGQAIMEVIECPEYSKSLVAS